MSGPILNLHTVALSTTIIYMETTTTDQYEIAGESLFDHHGVEFGTGLKAYETGHDGTHTLVDVQYRNIPGHYEILTDIPVYMIGAMIVGGRSAWTFATECCEKCSDRAAIFGGWVRAGTGVRRQSGSAS